MDKVNCEVTCNYFQWEEICKVTASDVYISTYRLSSETDEIVRENKKKYGFSKESRKFRDGQWTLYLMCNFYIEYMAVGMTMKMSIECTLAKDFEHSSMCTLLSWSLLWAM